MFPILVGHGLGRFLPSTLTYSTGSVIILNYLRQTPEQEMRNIGGRLPEIKKDQDLKGTVKMVNVH